MLVRYKMQNSNKGSLPFRHRILLSKKLFPKTPQEVEGMRRMPYAVGIVSKYQSNPRFDHWKTVKNILKHLRRTRNYMLVYGTKDLILTEYTDMDFKTDKDLRKSTSASMVNLYK